MFSTNLATESPFLRCTQSCSAPRLRLLDRITSPCWKRVTIFLTLLTMSESKISSPAVISHRTNLVSAGTAL